VLQNSIWIRIEVSEEDSPSAMSVCMLMHTQSVAASASQQQEDN
jgi:hypothetical protein